MTFREGLVHSGPVAAYLRSILVNVELCPPKVPNTCRVGTERGKTEYTIDRGGSWQLRAALALPLAWLMSDTKSSVALRRVTRAAMFLIAGNSNSTICRVYDEVACELTRGSPFHKQHLLRHLAGAVQLIAAGLGGKTDETLDGVPTDAAAAAGRIMDMVKQDTDSSTECLTRSMASPRAATQTVSMPVEMNQAQRLVKEAMTMATAAGFANRSQCSRLVYADNPQLYMRSCADAFQKALVHGATPVMGVVIVPTELATADETRRTQCRAFTRSLIEMVRLVTSAGLTQRVVKHMQRRRKACTLKVATPPRKRPLYVHVEKNTDYSLDSGIMIRTDYSKGKPKKQRRVSVSVSVSVAVP